MRLVPARVAWLSVLFLVAVVAGCKAQGNSDADKASLNRKIEVLVRGQFNLPPDYQVIVGERKPSKLAGYDSLQITFARGGRSTSTEFLITTDNTSLARLETFDLNKIPAMNIPVDARPVRGNPAARVTVINFDDLQCPYCARMHQELFPATLERYKDKVKFVYKDDPLTELHPWAMHAAVDSNCLALQNSSAYWGYIDYLHAHGQEISGDHNPQASFAALDRTAREQGKIFSLNAAKLDECLARQDETAVRTSMKEAEALGVDGTPALFIDGEHIAGALPAEQVWAAIDRALRAAGVEPPPPPQPQPAGNPANGLTPNPGSGK